MPSLAFVMAPPLPPTPCSPCLRVAGNKEGNCKGNKSGKSNDNSKKEGDGWRATKRAIVRVARVVVMAMERAMARKRAMVTATTCAMGMATRVAGTKRAVGNDNNQLPKQQQWQ